MKEITFINRNKSRWSSFEENMKKGDQLEPDQLADQFIQLTDDLAYARTFFPKSGSISYLNALTVKTHQEIYKNKKEKSSRLKSFWLTELPLELYHSRKYFIISMIIFGLAAALGAVSALNDDSFLRLILGDSYVNTTLDNIEKGNPMGIYESMGEFEMFFRITFNNIRVSFIVFVSGMLTAIGVGMLLMQNGIMLGAFQTFFVQKQLFSVSTLAIYIHGALEIPGIVIAGGAGIILGNSFLFPGTLPRSTSLMIGVKRGVKIIIGLIPVFFVAGFLESFVTRHYDTMPLVINLFIIIGSLFMIMWYFFVYPNRIYKRVKAHAASSNKDI
ncbi:stage II sporulation protein M [Labilibacter marinus]|uniref:stage II sporulation protein M n=1 Tax=Labilibacter marinus TaxID=1477105 RepID=UPI0008343040|nr:stage II sporulation protein M [Labilibacter marinus]